jgi:hypothetical protein
MDYLTLIKNDRPAAEKIFKKYWQLAHELKNDIYEHSNFYEATMGDPAIIKYFDSWANCECFDCGFYNQEKAKLDKNADYWKLELYEEYNKITPTKEKRIMHHCKTDDDLAWVFRCEKCFPELKKKEKIKQLEHNKKVMDALKTERE